MKIFKVLIFQKMTATIRDLVGINYYQTKDEETAQKYASSILENDPNYSFIVLEVEPKDIMLINNWE